MCKDKIYEQKNEKGMNYKKKFCLKVYFGKHHL